MTREELNLIGAMNECDEISNEAYAKISNHCDIEERKQGEWIESMYRTYVCSNCGENPTKGTGVTLTLTHLNYEYKYCRFCGAEMRGNENEDISRLYAK